MPCSAKPKLNYIIYIYTIIMPGKGSRKKRVRSLRHDPLEKQIMDSMETGTLKPQKKTEKRKGRKG